MPRLRAPMPALRTAPVLAVLVCHDGERWLPEALSALRRSAPRPRHLLAVDTGSTDGTPRLLADAAEGDDRVLDGVLTLPRDTGFAAAVHAAVAAALDRWGDPGGWIWVLHDDCAPDRDCLANLLIAADLAPSVGVLGPIALDWTDPRVVLEAGLSTDAAGHRQTGLGQAELARHFEQSTEVLAMSSAGLLVRRELWQRLDGFDRAIPAMREDVDFGWRANRAGELVLCVPAARLRHACAVTAGERGLDVGPAGLGSAPRVLDRAYGLRTFLVNCPTPAFLLGLPRLTVLCLLRALGFAVLRRLGDARAELRALGYLLGGHAGLREARAARRAAGQSGSVRGLFTSRFTRLRNGVRAGLAQLVRRRVEQDAALGEPDPDAVWLAPEGQEPPRRPVGPQALPAGVTGRPRRPAGLRRPATAVAVALPAPDRPRPSPFRRDGSGPPQPDLLLVQVSRGRLVREVLLAPPLLLLLGLAGIGLLVNAGRLGLDLAGGRLLPVPGLPEVWSEYVATWHPVTGGTAAPAPAALALLGGLGTVLAFAGGAPAAVALLLLVDLPLAGLSGYVATRRLPVRRWVRALVAAGYALLPPATAAVAQGRLDVVVVHVLLPAVVAGITSLFVRFRTAAGGTNWLSTAAGTALGLAAIGAFAPLVHLMLMLYALGGFVLVPGRRGQGGRRVVALFMLVLMPLVLLLPWPAVVILHPGVVAHGVGGWVAEQPVSPVELIALDPGGPGAGPLVGLAVLAALLAALVLRPHRAMLPPLILVLLGVLAVVVLRAFPAVPLTGGPAEHGWTGAGLLMAGWGMLLAVLAACRPGAQRPAALLRGAAAGAVLGLVGLTAGVLLAGPDGPLRSGGGPRLADTLANELIRTGRAVLVVPGDGGPVRQVAGRQPRFADDDLAPVSGATTRLSAQADDLRSAAPERVRAAIAAAAAAGVVFVVLPDSGTGDRVRAAAGDLVSAAPPTSDGRPVLRIQLAAGEVVLLSPELARQATIGATPPTTLGVGGLVPVDAAPPEVAVRVSDGPDGRLLVVAAEEEPGWQATVDGRPVPVGRAWGHLVAVQMPTRSAEVHVEQPGTLRAVLLVVQAAAVLFTLLTAIPGRPRRTAAAARAR
ncbi:MAG TPA: glycosyltransferase family 2 protein [Actinophytocola sp.]|uniref:glycosyltransferase family 2 protein n=1 Tax=Actinophytocola sp. TaxID=1872138 RepID=UPI002DBB563D|nr:glycosyltransferase family 2 protein [Actinophytocola sp.]HEU5475855.1 glycosyltransferase family 2 protein [Actinophytocola sp.]